MIEFGFTPLRRRFTGFRITQSKVLDLAFSDSTNRMLVSSPLTILLKKYKELTELKIACVLSPEMFFFPVFLPLGEAKLHFQDVGSSFEPVFYSRKIILQQQEM